MAWLKEFSVVMHRRYAYPPKHPSRVAAEGVAFAALDRALETYPEIAIAVSRHSLAIGGGFSDPKNPALCELAERLHRQGIGAITIRAGMDVDEFDALLTQIVEARPKDDDDLDESGPNLGAHVAIEMLTYEGLALSEEVDLDDGEAADITSDRLWRELAQATLGGWDGDDGVGSGGGGSAQGAAAFRATPRPSGAIDAVPADPAAPAEPVEGGAPAPPVERRSTALGGMRPSVAQSALDSAARLAKVINERATDKAFAADVLKSLIRVGRHSRRRGRAGSGAVAKRLRDVMAQLAPGTLKSLLESEPNPEKTRLLFLQGVDALPVSAVLDWIEAAAETSEKQISPYLLRMLKKLSGQARRRRDAGPDEGGEALRDAARQLIEGWSLETRETEQHSALLENISNYEDSSQPLDGGDAAGADRVVQMALETDAFGPDVMAAVDHLIDDRRLGGVLAYLDKVPESAAAVPSILDYLESPETLRRVLLTEPIDQDGTRDLLSRCGPARLAPLLDALTLSESQTTRSLIISRLEEIGEAARDQVVARLPESPWYVQRNLLMLLAAMPAIPPDLDVDAYMRSEEPGVRVEALKLLARMPTRREDAIHDALSDADLKVVRAALDAAAGAGLPRKSATRVLQIAQRAESGSEMRVKGIALLANVPLTAARDWLLPLVIRQRGVFFWRRWGFVEKSPEVLAAVRVLASQWRADPAAAQVFKVAAKSTDEQFRAAAGLVEGA